MLMDVVASTQSRVGSEKESCVGCQRSSSNRRRRRRRSRRRRRRRRNERQCLSTTSQSTATSYLICHSMKRKQYVIHHTHRLNTLRNINVHHSSLKELTPRSLRRLEAKYNVLQRISPARPAPHRTPVTPTHTTASPHPAHADTHRSVNTIRSATHDTHRSDTHRSDAIRSDAIRSTATSSMLSGLRVVARVGTLDWHTRLLWCAPSHLLCSTLMFL